MSLTTDTLRAIDDARRDVARLTDQRSGAILASFTAAWAEVEPVLAAAVAAALATGRITRSALTRDRALAAALDNISAALARATAEAAAGIVSDLGPATTGAAAAQSRVLSSQLPPGTGSPAAPPRDALDEIVRRARQQIHAASWPIPAQQVAVMKAELIRGVAAGANPRETATRIMARTGDAFVGGWSRAENIARTETLDAFRRAQAATDAVNRDLVSEWVWLCALSPRSCPACIARHGTRHPIDEPGPEGHQRCRCARVTVTKSWADLGFGGVTEPADVFPDAEAWFEGLAPEAQRHILGPARYDAWTRGAYPMSAWARRQTNPGWRPSWVTSPAPVGAR